MLWLFNSDCRRVFPYLKDKSVDLLCTDIPYGEVNATAKNTKSKMRRCRNLDKGVADVADFDLRAVAFEFCRITRGSIFCFCSSEQLSTLRGALKLAGMSTRVIVWEKTNPSPLNGQHMWLSGIELCVYGKFTKAVFNGFCRNTVLRCPQRPSPFHPTAKPEKIIEDFILTSSNSGDIVFDPFMGSGTTGVCALRSGRRFIGVERDAGYFEVARRRICG